MHTVFADRNDAAKRLAVALDCYRTQNPLVLAIPRGAVPMGRVIADELVGELDVVLVRKLRSPYSPEFAIGAVDESGWTYIAPHAREAGATDEYIEREKQAQLAIMKKRRALYTPGQAPLDPTGRIAIIVDDGLATGATMIAALHAVRMKAPARLVCAVPVASPRSLETVRAYSDEVVCLEVPQNFYAVGQFYMSFPQVEDREVVELLSTQRCKSEVQHD
jgi:putative phosphoribosyl transferase